jgi:choline kinase
MHGVLDGHVTQTVILAAGTGSRLASTENGVPKPLIHVAGRPLIAHALAHARASGCVEAVVVLGHEGGCVRQAVERMSAGLRIRFAENPDPAAPNGVSLLAAERDARDEFFLQMVDHVFAGPALPRLVASPRRPGDGGRVLVDRAPEGLDLDDATKVTLDADRVVAIGKGLPSWDAVDAGCFVLTHHVFDALRRVPLTEPRTVSSGMRQLASRGMLGAVDLGGIEWVDVDTPADRVFAERLLLAVGT